MKEGCSLGAIWKSCPRKDRKAELGQKRLQLRLGCYHVEPRPPELGQAPFKDSQDHDPNFLSPRTHFHRKDPMTLGFRLWSLEPLKMRGSVA